MSIVSRILPNERTRHVVIAAAIAFVLSAATLLEPLDRYIWAIESRLASHDTSGKIVAISADEDLVDPSRPDQRLALSRALENMAALDPDRIVLDMVIDKPSTDQADRILADTIAKLGDRIILVDRVRSNPDGSDRIESTEDSIAGDTRKTIAERYVDYSGFTWEMASSYEVAGEAIDTLPVTLAGMEGRLSGKFSIDYNFDPDTILSYKFNDFLSAEDAGNLKASLHGKTIILSLKPRSAREHAAIPGRVMLSESIVYILAAETLIRGSISEWYWMLVLAIVVIAAGLLAVLPATRFATRIGYLTIAASPIAFIYYCALSGATGHVASVLVFNLSFALLRIRAKWRDKQVMFDELVGLPTFGALERDLTKSKNVRGTTVVIAKLHRFDEVTSALSDAAIADYVQQIASRFRITEQDLQVYTKGGKYLAWLSETSDRDMLESHLRGLRAVFAHPLIVKEIPVDVGITFAADMTAEDNAARKIASASSTLEKTTESHEPVLFAEMASEGDRWWNISLQAKIDEALEQGHIYVVFQPKLNLRQGTVVGAEALVRWKDPERGNIAPNYFIEQRENAGRMDHLTRHVLLESLVAAREFAKTNAQFTVSVNISATMLRDYRVAEMIEEIIEKTGFNPRNLVLEITETSRISDYDIAFDVMTRLSLHGIKLSIDDFGVGSASMETLLRLPFDELKIDRAFIARIEDDPKARAISQMMIAFGKQTRISVVAEGVEDESHMRLLRDLGCEMVQGYHISKPLEKEKFSQFQLDNRRIFSKHVING